MTRQEHADAVVANLRAGKIDAREVILPPPPPVDADDLAPWMRETARPTAPTTATAAQLVERIDNLHAELVALLGLAVRSCPAPTSDRARRYQSVDLSSIHGLQRLLGHDVARLRNSVQQLHAANDLAALHDARATGRNVPATEPAR